MPKIPIHNRQFYYLASIAIVALAGIYCLLVYMSGSTVDEESGYRFLIGIPNYYFFYLAVLPFITAGIVFLAINNTNIRFFGELNEKISEDRKEKLLRYRRILLYLAVVISIAVTMNDAMEKGRTLPPYAIDFSSMTPASYTEAVQKYLSLKDEAGKKNVEATGKPNGHESETKTTDSQGQTSQSKTNGESKSKQPEKSADEYYHDFLKTKGFTGESITGFDSVSSWYADSSFIYKMESLLSWIAAFIISIFFAQVFLFIIAKDYVLAETKNLVLWLVILCSFWIPTKIFSVYYYSLIKFEPPGIVWFAIFLLAIGVVLALFIKVEKNDMTKYASYIAGVLSVAVTGVGLINPQYFEVVFIITEKLGWIYGGIILFIMGFSIYLVTDHLIQSYEKSKSNITVNSVRDNNTVKPA